MQEPDPGVVRAAAAGDEAAFATLVRSGQAHVWRFLCHLVGDPDAAADLTQETFVRVHRALPGFRFESRFTTWIFRIARNVAVDEGRRTARRERTRRLDVRRDEGGSDPATASELRAAVDALPDALREPFLLVEVFGLRYREAAEVLGVPAGTVKSRMFRARAELVAWYREGRDEAPGDTDRTSAGGELDG